MLREPSQEKVQEGLRLNMAGVGERVDTPAGNSGIVIRIDRDEDDAFSDMAIVNAALPFPGGTKYQPMKYDLFNLTLSS